MFAVSPKLWCDHLAGHVKPLPQGGIDSSLPCETCGTTQEAWICLNCYHVSEWECCNLGVARPFTNCCAMHECVVSVQMGEGWVSSFK